MPPDELTSSALRSLPEEQPSGETVRVLLHTANGVRQWTLALLLGEEEASSTGKLYRVHFGNPGLESRVREDAIEFFPPASPPTATDAYHQGVREAEVLVQDEVRDYERVLFGLSHVLASLGLAATPHELADLFHSPLASYPAVTPLEQFASALDLAMAGQESTWLEQHVLSGELASYRRYEPVEDLLVEEELRRHRRRLRDVLDLSPELRGTLATRLTTVRRSVQRIRRQVKIVETLLGGGSNHTRKREDFALELEAAASRMETKLQDEVRLIDARIKELPFERARALQTVRSLRLRRSAFQGNTAEPGCSFITDRCLAIRKEAIVRRDRAQRLADTSPRIGAGSDRLTEECCARVFDRAVAAATQEAEVLGYFEYVRHDRCKALKILRTRIAVVVTTEDEVAFLDADLVRFIDSLVGGFDSLKVRISDAGWRAQNPERREAYDPAVFYCKGQPAAILMPLRYNLEDIPIDIPTALEVAGVERPCKAPVEERTSQEALVEVWLELGNEVPWMQMASPPFGAESFVFCSDVDDLISRLLSEERHALGAAFALGDVCFICLNDLGRDEEWLAIKGSTGIGNIPLRVRDEDCSLDREATARRVREVVGRYPEGRE